MLLSLPQNRTTDTCIASTARVSWSWEARLKLTPKAQRARHRNRRVSRDVETSNEIVSRAIPAGFTRPQHTDEVLAALEDHPAYIHSRRDLRAALRKCVEVLIAAADFETMTTRPTWLRIEEAIGVTKRSVNRYMSALREMKLIGHVAAGRQAKYAQPGADGRCINEAAVYVLCVPDVDGPQRSKLPWNCGGEGESVDESVPPPMSLGSLRINPRTRASRRGSLSKEQKRLGCSVDQIRWNKHWVPRNRTQRRTAAWRLKALLPNVLGRMSDRDIASTIRDFLIAGWSVADITYALGTRPDGTPWPYSGAPETKDPHRVRGWLRFRLQAWRKADETPLISRDQIERAERERAREAYEEDLAQRERARQESAAPDSQVKQDALARIRRTLSRHRGRAAALSTA